ncbi:Crp/Fnr family transcriptional regulator [Solimonas sp. K1W22B-7]|uniref:Crp/Fnr family transcriptional regulator n=1 Tax=Solimonas sp. K1W22B-7 TaxID=2303331 RepID=UPI000E32F1A1|nr:Crp/Fnr family transcriptional regulator [Solimonas sp. K1W22B-7]AXQ27183.1 Crp/Fnr family transcriptional regulator [Solimonas sp. K1W22B-7]
MSKTLRPGDPRHLLPALGMDAVALAEWMRDLPPDLLQRFAAATVPRPFRAGEVLFHKGERADGLYFVESGEIRSSTVTTDGHEFILYLFEPGSCVGLSSALDGAPSSSTCRAFCNSQTRLLRRADLVAILGEHPHYYRQFTELLLRWVRGLLGLIEDQAVLSVRARLAKRLLQLAYLYGTLEEGRIVIPVKLPQEELGMLLGATRQSIHQQVAEFRRLGWISVHNSIFTLLDPAALAECIGGRGT